MKNLKLLLFSIASLAISIISCGSLEGAALPVKKGGFVYTVEESNNDEGNTVLVVLNNYKRKCCCKGSGMELVAP